MDFNRWCILQESSHEFGPCRPSILSTYWTWLWGYVASTSPLVSGRFYIGCREQIFRRSTLGTRHRLSAPIIETTQTRRGDISPLSSTRTLVDGTIVDLYCTSLTSVHNNPLFTTVTRSRFGLATIVNQDYVESSMYGVKIVLEAFMSRFL